MSDLLDPDAIDALLKHAKAGTLPTAGMAEARDDARADRWLRVVDFSRPTKFGPEEENRLRRLHEGFARLAGTRLVGQHRIPLELEVIDTSQRTWRDAHMMVSRDSVCALLEIKPHGTTCLMAVEMPLLLLSIDKLLGSLDDEPRERKLTDIDRALVRRVLQELVGALSTTWQDMSDVSFEIVSLENEVDTAQAIATSEPTLSIAMEARLGSLSSTLLLLVPHASVQPILAEVAQRSAAELQTDGTSQAMMLQRIGTADVTARAELGSAFMSLNDVLKLSPGDTIRLEGPPPGDADLVVDDITVCRTRAGRAGARRAVQIGAPTPIEEPAS